MRVLSARRSGAGRASRRASTCFRISLFESMLTRYVIPAKAGIQQVVDPTDVGFPGLPPPRERRESFSGLQLPVEPAVDEREVLLGERAGRGLEPQQRQYVVVLRLGEVAPRLR